MPELGKLIVIEGLDGSGKATQSTLLEQRLCSQNIKARRISFPDYDSPSSGPIKMYLAGELGGLDDVNIYAASSFYAVDRYASFQKDWKEDYLKGCHLVCDRYVTSNPIYQMAKLDRSLWDDYLIWCSDYEYTKLQLPVPTAVLYLDMSPECSEQLLAARYGGDLSKKDLHESSIVYQQRCREAALYTADKWHWHIVSCTNEQNQLGSIEEIAEKIWDTCNKYVVF